MGSIMSQLKEIVFQTELKKEARKAQEAQEKEQGKDTAYVKQMTDVVGPIKFYNERVTFHGGHAQIVSKVTGTLYLTDSHVGFFYNPKDPYVAIPIKDILKIQIVGDNYTPSLERGIIVAALGGDTSSQSYRPHDNNLEITFHSGKVEKKIRFEFEAVTWAGSVDACQKFHEQLNSLL